MAYQSHAMAAEVDEGFSENVAPHLDRSLDALAEKDREVITLHYLEGLPFKEISEQMGGTAGSWQKRSVRALEKLAGRLKSRGVTVTAMSLGAFFASARAEAGVTTHALETMTRLALEGGSTGTLVLGEAALILSMKTGIAISLTSGVFLAYGWGTVSHRISTTTAATKTAVSRGISDASSERRAKRDRGFTVAMVKMAVSEYDGAQETDPLAESRLRSLMFLVPEEHLGDVFQILLETGNHARFQQVAAALFGCWAEHDPIAALERTKDAGVFSDQARRAVIVTWLNQDSDAALSVILKTKTRQDLGFLREFLTYRCESEPRDAAALVDRLAENWPEADRPLFRKVAVLWSRSEPLEAGEWVASYHNEKLRNNLLKSIAVETARIRGYDGLTIANHIEDEKFRRGARNKAIYWWGIATGGHSLVAGKAKPVRDLSGGFPDDWDDRDIRSFSFATMINYSKNLPDLLKIAKNDEQRLLIYEGALEGSGWSNPAAVTEAAEELPESFVGTSKGKRTLEVLIRRWNEMDPEGVAEWLSKQQLGPKTDAMKAGLKPKGEE